ncbi:MAG: DNA primase [Clostridia bacterium]|nr:DNA primase [Clostridia bacterium]
MDSFEEFKQKVKDANDIVSVVSKYQTLNKKGKTWWSNCPFHYEKTPSFAVNEVEQYYHCFGCGVSGDVFKFVQHMEGCDFYDALKILAENAGLAVPDFGGDGKDAERKKEREQIYAVLREAALHYVKNLSLPDAKPALEYISKRRLNNEVVRAFGLGYSLGWNEVVDHLRKRGYSFEIMQKAGIIDKNQRGGYYDVYAKRLIFPIINSNDNVVGFSARVLDPNSNPKYRNTGETPVFQKNECVYGINLIKKLRRTEELKEIIIVEGQMDVISVHKSGVKNAVACLGTALTPNHAKQLKKYCNKVVVCFDGDGAGKKATLRSLDILVSAGLDVYVASMPAGIDPDEYVLANGVESYRELIADAKYWVEYLIREYASKYNLKRAEERNLFVVSALNIIKKLQSNTEQNVYLELVKSLSNISMDVLRRDLENIDNVKVEDTEQKDKEENVITKENAYVKAVKFVMGALLHKKDYATLNDDVKDNLLDSDIQKLYDYIYDCKQNGKTPIVSHVFDLFNVESNPIINDIVNFNFTDSINNEGYYNDCVKLLIRSGLEIKQKEIANKIALESDIDKRKELSKQLSQIILKQNQLRKK